jgi:osmotically-inducible protein OsmY
MKYRNAFLWYGTRASMLALIVGMTALGCARGGESRSDTRSGRAWTGTSRDSSSDQAYARSSSGDYTRSGTAGSGSRYGSTSGSQGYEQERGEPAAPHHHHRHATRTATAAHTGTTAGHATDRQLSTRVKQALSKDTQLRSTDVDVEASHGTVTLNGRVDQDSQRRKAEQLARKVKGVKKVENRIQVGSASNTQDER